MIKIDKIIPPSIEQWQAVIHGMRNPMNSWEKSDTTWDMVEDPAPVNPEDCVYIKIGPNDLDLMKRLAKAGSDHRKFLRMLPVMMDVTAPLYWWKEYDTYKVGTVANSCSTMHKIADKEFSVDDFSHEHLLDSCGVEYGEIIPSVWLEETIVLLNQVRKKYIETQNKVYWWQMIQLLPSSYNQKRTLFLNYEVLYNIYKARKDHKLDEWVSFCKTIKKNVPYFKEILL